jgi:cupin 2 domain-containing protein
MAEADLRLFLEKVRSLQAFVQLSEERPALRAALAACSSHAEVVGLARAWGFEIGRRWGESGAGSAGSAGLLGGPCPPAGQEMTTVLVQGPGFRLERIHSCEAASPEGFWYDQAEQEWLTLLQGSARLQFEDEDGARDLSRGDSLLIRRGRRHRVLATDPAPGTVWLVLFWSDPGPDS